jgi:1,4-alpha-glucan branching enzyme
MADENLEAVEFLRHFNFLTHTEHPGVVTIVRIDSLAHGDAPAVSRGLGFSLKWNMGWMHDTLGYFKRDPVYRKYHQNDLTFAMLYHHNENFLLPLSHDEVVHGKVASPPHAWRRLGSFRNLRALLDINGLSPARSCSSWAASSAKAMNGMRTPSSIGGC